MNGNRARIAHAAAAAILAAGVLATPAKGQLPPEARADLMTRQLMAAIEAKSYREVVERIAAIRKITPDLPDAFRFYEAQALIRSNQPMRGIEVLKTYLQRTGRKGDFYEEALALYPEAQKAAAGVALSWYGAINVAAVPAGGDLLGRLPFLRQQDVKQAGNTVLAVSPRRAASLAQADQAAPCRMRVVDTVQFHATIRRPNGHVGRPSNSGFIQHSSGMFPASDIESTRYLDLWNVGTPDFLELRLRAPTSVQSRYISFDPTFRTPPRWEQYRVAGNDRAVLMYLPGLTPAKRERIAQGFRMAGELCRAASATN